MPIYANNDNRTMSCLLFFFVGSFVPKLEWVSYKGFESKTVISNLFVDYMCVSALCVNKYSLLPDYEEENM